MSEIPSEPIREEPKPKPEKLSIAAIAHENMGEDIAVFEERYAGFAKEMQERLGLGSETVNALIGIESRYKPEAVNEHGSKGLMQLTTHPIEDLLERPWMFTPHFRKLASVELPANAPEALVELRRIFEAEPVDRKALKRILPKIHALKTDPSVNLFVCHVYLAALQDRPASDRPKARTKTDEIVKTIVANERLCRHVFDRVKEVIPKADLLEVVVALQEIMQEGRSAEFLALRSFNANPHAYGKKIRHQDIYACTILAIAAITENAEKKRIADLEESFHFSGVSEAEALTDAQDGEEATALLHYVEQHG